MQLTRYTDYSLRVLLYLAMLRHSQPVTIGEIAQRFQIPTHHLTKIVHHLGKLGYLETTRGRGGGIRLGCPPEAIVIGRVVRDTEPNLEVINCNEPPCPIRAGCQLKGVLGDAQGAFMEVLDQYSLADLTRRPTPALAALRDGVAKG